MMRRKDLIAGVGTLLLVGLAVACSINPQPLPPDAPGGYDASSADPTNGGGGTGAAANEDAGAAQNTDAGILGAGPTGSDAATSEDAAAPEDAGDSGDGGEDGSAEEDASPDASDAG